MKKQQFPRYAQVMFYNCRECDVPLEESRRFTGYCEKHSPEGRLDLTVMLSKDNLVVTGVTSKPTRKSVRQLLEDFRERQTN